MMNLSDLFPDEDYRFHMALRRGTPQEFFGRTPTNQALLAERQRWLQNEPLTYSACLPESAALVETCIVLAHEWGAISEKQRIDLITLADPRERCAAFGQVWEPDFLLLKSNVGTPHRLLAGCVCFPSSWNLAEKIGQPLETIHGVVPSLNAQIGSSIHSFLSRLTPGAAWLRHNWGLSRSSELNQHPRRVLPKLDGAVELPDVWLRVEHQALVALPQSGGVLFGIRVVMHSLDEVKKEPAAALKLVRALRTMPAEVTAYKGLAVARDRIIELLQ
jgi:hypothetical protein